MANVRIKDLSTTASTTASDDFFGVDGATNGTRKLNAYSPTFGGNLTVNGSTVLFSNSGAGGPHISFSNLGGSTLLTESSSGAFYFRAYSYGLQDLAGNSLLSVSSTGNLTVSGTGTSSVSGRLQTGVGVANSAFQLLNSTSGSGASDGLALELSGANAYFVNYENGPMYWFGGSAGATQLMSLSASGNLTVSGGTITSGSATLTLNSSANTVVLQSAGTTALTLDSSQNATFAALVKTKLAFEAYDGATADRWQLYTYTDKTFRWNYNGSGSDELSMDTSGNLIVAGSMRTGTPVGGTASAWKFGKYNTTAPSATGYVEVDIGGTLYKLLAST